MINSSANFEVHTIHRFFANREALSGFLLILLCKAYCKLFVLSQCLQTKGMQIPEQEISWEEPPLYSSSFKGRNLPSRL